MKQFQKPALHQDQQAQHFTDAIMTAIMITGSKFEKPSAAAISSALVAAQGAILAELPRQERAALKAKVTKALPRAISNASKQQSPTG